MAPFPWPFLSPFRCIAQTELHMQASLDHPYILKPHDIFDTPSSVVLVLPYVRNGDLSSALRKSERGHFGEVCGPCCVLRPPPAAAVPC